MIVKLMLRYVKYQMWGWGRTHRVIRKLFGREHSWHNQFILRYITKDVITSHIQWTYEHFTNYDPSNAYFLLVAPRRIKVVARVGYLYLHIMMGRFPKITKQFTLEDVLKLNKHKDDIPFTNFLHKRFQYEWDGSNPRLTRKKLESMMEDAGKVLNKS